MFGTEGGIIFDAMAGVSEFLFFTGQEVIENEPAGIMVMVNGSALAYGDFNAAVAVIADIFYAFVFGVGLGDTNDDNLVEGVIGGSVVGGNGVYDPPYEGDLFGKVEKFMQQAHWHGHGEIV